MILHLVLIRFASDPERTRTRLAERLDALPGLIPEIRAWRHGPNATTDEDAWDYGLEAEFASRADLETYFAHPAHVAVLTEFGDLVELGFADLERPGD